jgi:hypothetical protein
MLKKFGKFNLIRNTRMRFGRLCGLMVRVPAVLWFLWGTNWIYICYVEESRLPLWSSGHSSCIQYGDVLWFLWGTNWIYICYVEESRLPLWSSGQSSCLQMQRSGFDSRRYQIFWEIGGLERVPLSLVSTTEELLGRNIGGTGLENRSGHQLVKSALCHSFRHQTKASLFRSGKEQSSSPLLTSIDRPDCSRPH